MSRRHRRFTEDFLPTKAMPLSWGPGDGSGEGFGESNSGSGGNDGPDHGGYGGPGDSSGRGASAGAGHSVGADSSNGGNDFSGSFDSFIGVPSGSRMFGPSTPGTMADGGFAMSMNTRQAAGPFASFMADLFGFTTPGRLAKGFGLWDGQPQHPDLAGIGGPRDFGGGGEAMRYFPAAVGLASAFLGGTPAGAAMSPLRRLTARTLPQGGRRMISAENINAQQYSPPVAPAFLPRPTPAPGAGFLGGYGGFLGGGGGWLQRHAELNPQLNRPHVAFVRPPSSGGVLRNLSQRR